MSDRSTLPGQSKFLNHFAQVGQKSVQAAIVGGGLLAAQFLLPLPLLAQNTPIDSPPPGSSSVPATQPTSDMRFSCQSANGQYVVMYNPQSQPGKFYPWATPSLMGGGWTPERRCNEISRRLETYRPDGLLEMRTATENGYNTICVTTEQVPTCRIVLTVPEGQDPTVTRDRVFGNLTTADSGTQTNAVNTYTGSDAGRLINQIGSALGINIPSTGGQRHHSSDAIDLRPFLDRADGGTGSQLQGGGGARLNPNRFR